MKKATLFTILILLTGCFTRTGVEAPLLLANPGFEEGWHLATTFWTPEGGPFYNQYQEITPPKGWTAWWREGFPCAGGWLTRRPEVRVISEIPDAERVRSGEQATQWFTFWGCHSGGLYQQVAVIPGHSYTFSVYAHAWYSRCSNRPHDPPYDTDCKTRIYWAQDWLSVGIDPTGGIDPMGPSVVWGERQQIYGVYGPPLEVERVRAQGPILTVFVRSEASHPLKHNDFYLDDAVLLGVTYRAFLPIVAKGAR